MTEILKDQLWLCGIGELRREIYDAKPFAIFNLALPDDIYPWENTCADLVELYHHWPIADGLMPDISELTRLTELGVELINEQKRLIVHCASGHNRSGLVAALIVREMLQISGQEAIEFLQERRRYVLWNKHFSEYLRQLGPPYRPLLDTNPDTPEL
jgi:protein-tyrosine phosphatase